MKKDRTLRDVCVMVMMLLLVACSQESTDEDVLNQEYPVTLNAGLLQSTVVSSTRATTDNNWTGLNNKVVAVQIDGKTYRFVTSVNEDGTAVLRPAVDETIVYWSGSTDTKTISAWYPITEGDIGQKPGITVNSNQSSDTDYHASDYIELKETTVAFANRSQTYTFTHRTAKVSLILEAGSGISANNFATVATTVKNAEGTVFTTHQTSTALHEVILAPGAISGEFIVVTLTLNGTQKTFTYSVDSSFDLEAGKNYQYKVTVTSSGLSVSQSTNTEDDTASENETVSYTQGQWIKMATYNGHVRAYASSFTIGTKGYLCGGFRGSNREYLNDLWEFDMNGSSRGVWTQRASMIIGNDTIKGRKAAVGFAVAGKGYVTTGSVKNGSSSDFVDNTFQYDPDTNTWTEVDPFAGGARNGALAFSIGNYGYVGTGFNDANSTNIGYMVDFYRFDPTAASGSQWTQVSGFGGEKRRYGTAFVINDVAYICCGESNSTNVVDFWKFDGTTWTRLRDIADTSDGDYDDDYTITRYGAVSFAINGYGYVATGYRSGVMGDYWKYDPTEDLWYGDSDDDFTTLSDVHNYPSGASSRCGAVSFSNGSRGFVLTGQSGGTYFDDVYELLPDLKEEN